MSVQENAKKLNDLPSGPLVDTIEVPQGTSRISCDGGGALGHPVIWLTLIVQASEGTLAVCPYCSRQFVSK
ncbi:MAG: zinc-finger domain-containing protein [Pseudomonadota bacterium]|nr:zinc-finger domain-containing protein [Pseudomonadota bacterium]